jgi:hypothetical protein
MLKAFHMNQGASQASSLYCQWILVERAQGKQLVAVWMDNKMRAFAGETQSQANMEVQTENLAEEPGGARAARALCQTEPAELGTGCTPVSASPGIDSTRS